MYKRKCLWGPFGWRQGIRGGLCWRCIPLLLMLSVLLALELPLR